MRCGGLHTCCKATLCCAASSANRPRYTALHCSQLLHGTTRPIAITSQQRQHALTQLFSALIRHQGTFPLLFWVCRRRVCQGYACVIACWRYVGQQNKQSRLAHCTDYACIHSSPTHQCASISHSSTTSQSLLYKQHRYSQGRPTLIVFHHIGLDKPGTLT